MHAGRYVLAVAAAGSLAAVSGFGHAYWAMAAAAVPLAAVDRDSWIRRGIHRIAGTCTGPGVSAPALLPGGKPVALALLVVIFLVPAELFMFRHYGLALTIFTPVILWMTQLANPAPPLTVLGDRGLETVIGALAGITVAVLIRDPGQARSPRRGSVDSFPGASA